MTSLVIAAAVWTCVTSAEVIGPRESIAFACPHKDTGTPVRVIELDPLPMIATQEAAPKIEIATPKPKPKVKRIVKRRRHIRRHHGGACGSKRPVWYVNDAGRRKYRCR